ncbi:YqeG family HAD IIIA-type phosphatase [Thermoproteota archaeon]
MDYFFSWREIKQVIKRLLTPRELLDSVESINMGYLYDQGYRTVFLDIDNTILIPGKRNMTLQKEQWVEKVKSIGFQVYVISNNISYQRVSRVCKQLGVFGLYLSLKPLVFNVKELIRDNNIDPEKIIVVGDQVLTDVIFGNWMRAYSILVEPMNKKASFLKAVQWEIEVMLLKSVGAI